MKTGVGAGSTLTKNFKGLNAQLLSGLGAASRRSVWEQELHEVFYEDVGGSRSERVYMVHLDLQLT
jgi:hypothetical protein